MDAVGARVLGNGLKNVEKQARKMERTKWHMRAPSPMLSCVTVLRNE